MSLELLGAMVAGLVIVGVIFWMLIRRSERNATREWERRTQAVEDREELHEEAEQHLDKPPASSMAELRARWRARRERRRM